jgi:hypothetical protein
MGIAFRETLKEPHFDSLFGSFNLGHGVPWESKLTYSYPCIILVANYITFIFFLVCVI